MQFSITVSIVNNLMVDVHFSWQQFLQFLEKVQSAQTGLPIPQSKRPLEYARQYPEPLDSWPRAKESPRHSPPPSHRNVRLLFHLFILNYVF